jgi:hypothetical protein
MYCAILLTAYAIARHHLLLGQIRPQVTVQVPHVQIQRTLVLPVKKQVLYF